MTQPFVRSSTPLHLEWQGLQRRSASTIFHVAQMFSIILRLTFPIEVKLTEKFGLAKVKGMLKDIVNSCYDSVVEKQKAEGYIVLECGLATIPLSGALMSHFHSRYLWSGVMSFWGFLSKKIRANLLESLASRGYLQYIPNLVASPLVVNKAYAELSFTTVFYHHVSRKFFANGMKKCWDGCT